MQAVVSVSCLGDKYLCMLNLMSTALTQLLISGSLTYLQIKGYHSVLITQTNFVSYSYVVYSFQD